ncbi:pancreatic trypsin inhibitor-like [Hemicordylus capensis]|uniref:pancreatic trypsin inhibitor-like n=1 Tax=Hemicordylus capensis TaxID=884348 RepID=UPI002303289E|nr:pancreatic trypsin inhibitor-like [Hemicordylus capensis]
MMGSGGLVLLLGLLLLSAELALTTAGGRPGYCLHAPRTATSPSGKVSCQKCAVDLDCPAGKKCCGSKCGNTCQTPQPNRCQLPPETGICKARFTRYFYNWRTKRCETFIYGGCLGNLNRFEMEQECQRACGGQDTL